jgi:pyruvate/2-oxoglutarate dehydrogenase complex dihydrolipoamide acyltransferase (E2) component
MPEAKPLLFPLLNPNETEALVARLYVDEGRQVKEGDLLYTLETTKSTAEVNAEEGGYIIGLQVSQGDTVTAGDLFAYLAETQDWRPSEPEAVPPAGIDEEGIPEGLQITEPAKALARQHNINLTKLPIGPLVTESVVRELISELPKLSSEPSDS